MSLINIGSIKIVAVLFVVVFLSACSLNSERYYSAYNELELVDFGPDIFAARYFELAEPVYLEPFEIACLDAVEIGYLEEGGAAFEMLWAFLVKSYEYFNERRFIEAFSMFYPSEERMNLRGTWYSIVYQTPEDVTTVSNYQVHTIERVTPNIFLVYYTYTFYDFYTSNYYESTNKRYILLTSENRLFVIDSSGGYMPYRYRGGLTDYDLTDRVGTIRYRLLP